MIEYRHQLGELLDILKLPRIAAEIGVGEGAFSKRMLEWDLEKLYLVDAWRHMNQFGDANHSQEWHDANYEKTLKTIEPYEGIVTVLKGLSQDMVNQIPHESLGLLYVDCDHSYEGCKRDLEQYIYKVKIGGVVAGHDFLNLTYGVNKAANEFCAERMYEIVVIPDEDESMAGFWFIKTN